MKRALIAALPAVLVFGLVACGDDDDSVSTEPGSVTTTTERESETDSTDRSSVTLPDLSDVSIPDITLPPDFTLPGGITIPDLGSVLPGGTLPDLSGISIPELPTGISVPSALLEQILRGAIPSITDDQIDCVIDELGGKLDLQRLPDIAQTCEIDLGQGG
jgi:hypothetical protein